MTLVSKALGALPASSATIRRRLGAIAVVASALTAALLAVTAAPAQAATAEPRQRLSGRAVLGLVLSRAQWPRRHTAVYQRLLRATSQCVDIQLKGTGDIAFHACVVFITKTSSCNYWTFIPSDSTHGGDRRAHAK